MPFSKSLSQLVDYVTSGRSVSYCRSFRTKNMWSMKTCKEKIAQTSAEGSQQELVDLQESDTSPSIPPEDFENGMQLDYRSVNGEDSSEDSSDLNRAGTRLHDCNASMQDESEEALEDRFSSAQTSEGQILDRIRPELILNAQSRESRRTELPNIKPRGNYLVVRPYKPTQ